MRLLRASVAIAFVLGGAACNLLTGVGDLSIDDGAVGVPDRDAETNADAIANGDSSIGDGGATPNGDGAASSDQVVFLATAPIDSGMPGAYPGIVAISGGTPRAIGCTTAGAMEAFELSPPVGATSNTPNGPYRVGNLSSRAFGTTFLYLDTLAAGATPALLAANEGTDCAANPPKRIDRAIANDEVVPAFPRFAPNGARVAYVEQASDRASRVVTVSAGGPSTGAANVIRASGDVGGGGAMIWLTPPAWLANDELVWVEAADGPTYLPQTIRRAKDSASAAVQTLSTCNRYIEQVEIFTRNGAQHVALVSAAQSYTQQNGGSSTTIGVFPLAETCTSAKPLVTDTSNGTVARDVTVSPDGAFIAFAANLDVPAANRSLTSPLNVFVVDSLGNGPPVRCSDPELTSDEFAPQWLANGTKLVWMKAARSGSRRESLVVADVANGTCSNVRALLDDPTSGARYLTQANAGVACGVALAGRGAGEPVVVIAFGALFLAGARRRRRERRTADRVTE